MKLDQVILTNFRQYFGQQIPLMFSRSKEKNVTLIQGINGAGKSNLFKAINWCIYGSNIFNDEGKNKGEIVNKEALQRAKIGEKLITSVQVNFFHKGEKYILSRNITCVKESEIDQRYTDEMFTMMKIVEGGRSITVSNPVGQINAILPENVRTYFLFDGEKIDNFSKPGSADDVRNAVYNVLKLEVLERGKKHLEEIATEYRSELKRIASVKLQALISEFEQKKDQEKDLLQKVQEIDKEVSLAKGKIKDIDFALDSMKESHQLQKDRSRIEEEKKRDEIELGELKEQIRTIVTSVTSGLNEKLTLGAIAILDAKRIKGEIPSNIRQQFLTDIIDQKECICGRKFEKDGAEHVHLLSLQKNTVSSTLEEEVIRLAGNLRGLREEIESKKHFLDSGMQKSVLLRDHIDLLETDISEISLKLKGSRAENVEQLERQRESFSSDINRLGIEKAESERNLTHLEKQLKDLNAEISKAEKNKTLERELTNKMNIAQKSANAISAIYHEFGNQMRGKIESRTKDIFQKLIWKESQFHDVSLDVDYKLEVFDRWNRKASPELSAGERQVLSLAFITAMAKESGEEAPLVMDTPFGRLSRLHRDNITKNIPLLADQLVLFITDEEMNDTMTANLSEYVGEKYTLTFDDTTGCTTIERN